MVLEAGYPNTTGFRKVVKATIMVKKKPDMSDEDFIEHYNHKHAQMAAPVLLKHGIISYSLDERGLGKHFAGNCKKTYCLKSDRKTMLDIMKGKNIMLDYDAICTFVFKSYKDFATFLFDKDSKALTPDHENFMVEEDMRMMVGDEYVVVEVLV